MGWVDADEFGEGDDDWWRRDKRDEEHEGFSEFLGKMEGKRIFEDD